MIRNKLRDWGRMVKGILYDWRDGRINRCKIKEAVRNHKLYVLNESGRLVGFIEEICRGNVNEKI